MPPEPLGSLPPGLIVAAPRSGAGKTTVALGLMRALSDAGKAVQPFKNGPDYIDPAFHTAATGRASFNLDSWAMPRELLLALVGRARGADLAICEGSMGLFDGGAKPGAHGTGATADIAALAGWPVLLVLDVSGQAQSVAAEALGFARLRPDVSLGGVVLNRVASDRHEFLTRQAIEAIGIPVLGALRRDPALEWPERHLGLVQAGELSWLGTHLETLAAAIAESCDLPAILNISRNAAPPPTSGAPLLPPAQRIALARDQAFSFLYPHLLDSWREAGAEILPFSPLNDEEPDPTADLVWLPGGYPELHAGRLAANARFFDGLRRAASRIPVHGECGGYMVLGETLEDADGARHAMVGLLGHSTSFAQRRLHLGYRAATLLAAMPLGRAGEILRGHEFHYARVTDPGRDAPLAALSDAQGASLGNAGGRRGNVTGTFFHAIAAEG
jgi:cobyrinic acid a,c-diamide synthase